jgi:ATP phosphoribosyltransferase
VLLVRAADVPEYVQDGVVDCGITGIDLVRESGAAVHESLTLAVSQESSITRLADLRGVTVATVYPRLALELLPAEVTLVDITGSVELAPRLGLADAIVDLVSSGNTLRTNGLRSLGVLLESEAVLVVRDDGVARPFAAMLRAVVDARRHRYLMLNAPESALPGIAALVAPRVPSVLPLAEPEMVAVHALVPAAEIWQLLPQLEALGASSILIVPVERMAA